MSALLFVLFLFCSLTLIIGDLNLAKETLVTNHRKRNRTLSPDT